MIGEGWNFTCDLREIRVVAAAVAMPLLAQ